MRAADDFSYIRSKMDGYGDPVDYSTFGKALHIAIVCQLHSDSLSPIALTAGQSIASAYPDLNYYGTFRDAGDPEC